MIASLGIVTVTGTEPVSAVSNLSGNLKSYPPGAQRIRFQVVPANAGVVYIGFANMDIAGTDYGDGLLAVLPKPVSATTGPFDFYEAVLDVSAGLNPADFYVHGASAGDGVIVSLTGN